MFLMNVESLMPGVQNLWSEVRFFLLSAETLPVLLISKAVTVVLMCVMSVEKCAYLFVLSMFRCEMFTSRGTVSSNMWNLLFTLSQMVEILYYRCKHENNVLTLVVGSSFLLSPASEKGKCILWVSDFY